MKGKSLFWKIPLAVTGVPVGIVLLLLIVATGVIVTPAARKAVLAKGVEIANEKADYDIDLGELYLSPFHHSPMVLYRAYKGQADLPLAVEIDSLFVGHRGVDTLIYTRALRLNAKLMTAGREAPFSDFLSIPIEVEQLRLDETTFHSDSLIAAVGIDAMVGLLDVRSPELIIAEGKYPLHGLRLNDAFVGIDLRGTSQDTTAQDTTPMQMAFDAPDAQMRNIRFRLTPLGMDIRTDTLSANVLADVGGNLYDARRIDIGGLGFGLGNLSIPADTIYGNARVDLARRLITSKGLHVRSDEMGAKADLQTTEMNLETMQVAVTGDAEYQGSKARLRAKYDIDDEAYDAHVDIEKVNLAPFLKDSTPVVLAGEIDAAGKGINPKSRAMKSKVKMHLTDARYDNINVSGMRLNAELANRTVAGTLHLPVKVESQKSKVESLQVAAQTEHQFRVADFMTIEQIGVDYRTQMRNVKIKDKGAVYDVQRLDLHFATDSTTALELATEGLAVDVASPMHVMRLVQKVQPLLNAVSDSAVMTPITSLQDLTMLDTLRRLIPDLTAHIALAKGSPVQSIIEQRGLDINEIDLSLASDSLRTDLVLDASIPEISHPEDSTAMRLPAAKAAMRVAMTEGRTDASLTADSRLTDGAMNLYGLCTDAALRLDVTREENLLHGNGRLKMDSLFYHDTELGNHAIDLTITPSEEYTQALRVDVNTEDIPLDIVESFVSLPDIALHGAVKAHAAVDGLPKQTDISARVLPIGVNAEYKPYEVGIGLGETPILMEHNHINLNGLPV